VTFFPSQSARVPVIDGSQPGEARRVAASLTTKLGLGESAAGAVALVVTEMATNLVKHAAGGGELLMQPGEQGGLEILSLDRGTGMGDVGRCLTDGYSTAGSPGNGLGAMARLAETFDIHSLPGVGTAVFAGFRGGTDKTGFEIGSVNLPKSGEEVCGDSWAVDERGGRLRCLLVDGLGHGLPAAEAARQAVQAFRDRPELGLTDLIRAMHEALRGTRGAALAVSEIDASTGTLRYCGVGNIAASIQAPATGRSQSLVSHNGTVGHQLRKAQEFTYPWEHESLLVMHSDGLSTQWRLDGYPGLTGRHPALVAGVLYRDFSRGRDDVTVVAARGRRSDPR